MVHNRRIDERVPVGAMRLTWEPAVDDETNAGIRETQQALLMDISMSGAGLFGPTDPHARVGDLFVVGFNASRAVVEVRRSTMTDDVKLRYFGVQFVAMERAFERDLFDVIARP